MIDANCALVCYDNWSAGQCKRLAAWHVSKAAAWIRSLLPLLLTDATNASMSSRLLQQQASACDSLASLRLHRANNCHYLQLHQQLSCILLALPQLPFIQVVARCWGLVQLWQLGNSSSNMYCIKLLAILPHQT